MVIVLVRTKLRGDADLAAYGALNTQMEALLRSIPGFVDVNGYASTDGDEIGVVRFESLASLRTWREHPEHREVQARGRAEFYASYRIEVAEVVRAYEFTSEAGRKVVVDHDPTALAAT
jgi:heme-degrading monooxygenase HmoA